MVKLSLFESSTSADLVQVHQILVWQPSQKATSWISFLDLPPELRQMVYQYALQPQGLIHMSSRDGHMYRFYNENEDPTQPCKLIQHYTHVTCNLGPISVALLRTCRQVHAEAASYLYNTISIGTNPAIETRALELQLLDSFNAELHNPIYQLTTLISRTYAPLVRRLIRHYCQGLHISHAAIHWTALLTESHQLTALFPAADICLTFWGISGRETCELLDLLPREAGETHDVHVQRIWRWMRTAYQLNPVTAPEALHLHVEPGIEDLDGTPGIGSRVTEDEHNAFGEALELFKRRRRRR